MLAATASTLTLVWLTLPVGNGGVIVDIRDLAQTRAVCVDDPGFPGKAMCQRGAFCEEAENGVGTSVTDW